MANLRVTRVQTEVAGSTTGANLRVTKVSAEVGGVVTGNTARCYNLNLNILADAEAGIEYPLTVTSALSLAHSASRTLVPAAANAGAIWAGTNF